MPLATLFSTLAQEMPWDDPPAHPAPTLTAKPTGFHDLQRGFQTWYSGGVDDKTFRNGALALVVFVIVAALVLHLRQQRKSRKVVQSQFHLGLALSRLVPFPFGTRILLWWVAHSTGQHFATLLISSQAFETALADWSAQPTFTLFRRWGHSRLLRLHPILFASPLT